MQTKGYEKKKAAFRTFANAPKNSNEIPDGQVTVHRDKFLQQNQLTYLLHGAESFLRS